MQRTWWETEQGFWRGGLFDDAVLRPNDRQELRIQFLRDQFLQRPARGFLGEASIDRAILVTESYKETEGQPTVIRRARATEKILKNIPIKIYPGELIVGLTSTGQRSVNVCPEFHTHFLELELDLNGKKTTELDAISERDECRYVLSEEDKKRLRDEIFPYWRGKSTYAYCMEELKRNYPEIYKAELYAQMWDFIYRCENPGNTILDHASVLKKGLLGLKTEIEGHIIELDIANPSDLDRRNMYESMKIVADAIIAYANRYAKEAERLVETEPDEERRKELLEIAKVCRNVPANPASNWWEALQSFWFVNSIPRLIENGSSYSIGRLDQYLYPYLKRDLDSGKISRKQAQELLECLWLKTCQARFLYDYVGSKLFADQYDVNNVTIGGVDSEGNDATNELTYMTLEAEAHVHLPEPNLQLRIHDNTPEKLVLNALEVLRLGACKPNLVNDKVIIPSLMSRGVPLAAARCYASVGCQENTTDPNMTPEDDTCCRTGGGFYNLVKAIEYALNEGINPSNNMQLGTKTPDPTTFDSIEDLMSALKAQDDYFVKLLVGLNNVYDHLLSKEYPSPLVSLLLPGPRRKGLDRAAGGCKYNFTGVFGVGLGNSADILAAIEYAVFDKKIVTMKTLLDALKKNWSGFEELREECRKAPKYGNDDDYADRFFRRDASLLMDSLERMRCVRGGPCYAGFLSMSAYVSLGWTVGATPDGRRAGEPLADTTSPAVGMDKSGPTATHKSAAKLDTLRTTNGVIFNQRFNLGTVSTEADLHKWMALLRTFFDLGGQEVSYSVIGKETLLNAQKNPEQYSGLVVRVAGYCALFTELSKEVQDTIIARTEHSW